METPQWLDAAAAAVVVAACPGVCRCGTGEDDERGMSSGQTLPRSADTGVVSAPCGGRSRAHDASRRCGTVHHRRCTCTEGPRVLRACDVVNDSWW